MIVLVTKSVLGPLYISAKLGCVDFSHESQNNH